MFTYSSLSSTTATVSQIPEIRYIGIERSNDLSKDDYIQIGIGITTLLAVVTAIFSDRIRARLNRPKIDFMLRNDVGEINQMELPSQFGPSGIFVSARYYHFTISNRRRYPVEATEVQVTLVSIEHYRNGKYNRIWDVEIPFAWRNHPINPAKTRVIGIDTDCDLFNVLALDTRNVLQLQLQYYPNNVPYSWDSATKLRLIVRVVYREGHTKMHAIDIDWDGNVAEDDEQMRKHLKIDISPMK